MSAIAAVLTAIVIIVPGPPDPSAGSAPAVPAPPAASPSLGQAVGGVANGLGQTTDGLGQSVGGLGRGVGGNAGGLGSAAGGAVGGLTDGVAKLDGWKLSVPVKSDKGSATSVNPAQGNTGPWMTKTDGRLRFWAPVHGATTPNSPHTRTELDSLHNFPAGYGQHTLRASVSVDQVPHSTPDIIIGQIHGAATLSSSSFVMLHYDGGLIRVTVKHGALGTDNDQHKLMSGIPLGARFDYTITDNGDGTVGFGVTYNGQTKTDRAAIPADFKGKPVRFQAGDYQQAVSSGGKDSDSSTDNASDSGSDATSAADGSAGQDGGRVTFYGLDETHSGAGS